MNLTTLRSLLCLLLAAVTPRPVAAADYYVDNTAGNDARDGLGKTVSGETSGPFRTIKRALKLAGAGDTVHLNPTGTLYRETADFYGNKGGTEDKPLVLDGHGATLSGADPCPPNGWTASATGLLTRTDMVARIFLLIDGQTVFETRTFNVLRPGEFCFMTDYNNRLCFCPPPGRQAGECAVEVGQPDGSTVKLEPAQWQPAPSSIPTVRRYNGLKPPTWVKLDGQNATLITAKERLEPGQWCAEKATMYFRPPAGKGPQNLVIECPVRTNGVQLSGDTAHVIVRNLNVRHVYDDAYNVHGRVSHTEFINCNADHCGDQGFSQHDTCETRIDGAIYAWCQDGVRNVNHSRATVRNLIVFNCRAAGYAATEQACDTLENVILINNPDQLSLASGQADNVLIVKTDGSPAARTQAIGCGGNTQLRRLTVAGNSTLLRLGGTGEVLIENCLFAPGQTGFHVRAEEPLALLKLKNLVVGPGLTMEWGLKFPWHQQPLADWLADATRKGVAENVRAVPLDFQTALVQGTMPATLPPGVGCAPDLIQRFVDYLKQAPER